jgi:hypothetical protein
MKGRVPLPLLIPIGAPQSLPIQHLTDRKCFFNCKFNQVNLASQPALTYFSLLLRCRGNINHNTVTIWVSALTDLYSGLRRISTKFDSSPASKDLHGVTLPALIRCPLPLSRLLSSLLCLVNTCSFIHQMNSHMVSYKPSLPSQTRSNLLAIPSQHGVHIIKYPLTTV